MESKTVKAQLLFTNTPMKLESNDKVDYMKPDDTIPPRPIPFSERLPKPHDSNMLGLQDCDSQGRCWCWYTGSNFRAPYWEWSDDRADFNSKHTHWLPHWALPMPEVKS